VAYVLAHEILQLVSLTGFVRVSAFGLGNRVKTVYHGKPGCAQIQAHATENPLLTGDVIQADELPFEEFRPAT
jgi:hypothetical protein